MSYDKDINATFKYISRLLFDPRLTFSDSTNFNNFTPTRDLLNTEFLGQLLSKNIEIQQRQQQQPQQRPFIENFFEDMILSVYYKSLIMKRTAPPTFNVVQKHLEVLENALRKFIGILPDEIQPDEIQYINQAPLPTNSIKDWWWDNNDKPDDQLNITTGRGQKLFTTLKNNQTLKNYSQPYANNYRLDMISDDMFRNPGQTPSQQVRASSGSSRRATTDVNTGTTTTNT